MEVEAEKNNFHIFKKVPSFLFKFPVSRNCAAALLGE